MMIIVAITIVYYVFWYSPPNSSAASGIVHSSIITSVPLTLVSYTLIAAVALYDSIHPGVNDQPLDVGTNIGAPNESTGADISICCCC
jgi:hypothetical protein